MGFAVTQSHLLELVESYVNMSDRAAYGNTQSYLSQCPMRDRLWRETRNYFSVQCHMNDKETNLLEDLSVGIMRSGSPH